MTHISHPYYQLNLKRKPQETENLQKTSVSFVQSEDGASKRGCVAKIARMR
jgi:hypothetical protein